MTTPSRGALAEMRAQSAFEALERMKPADAHDFAAVEKHAEAYVRHCAGDMRKGAEKCVAYVTDVPADALAAVVYRGAARAAEEVGEEIVVGAKTWAGDTCHVDLYFRGRTDEEMW